MSEEKSESRLPVQRVRELAAAFVKTDLVRVRIERGGDIIELCRSVLVPAAAPALPDMHISSNGAPKAAETIKADLVGVFRLSRPVPHEGELLEGDRELAYVEALGIRNPVRSRGKGRIAAVLCQEGAAVEYGQPLFEIERS